MVTLFLESLLEDRLVEVGTATCLLLLLWLFELRLDYRLLFLTGEEVDIERKGCYCEGKGTWPRGS